MVVTSFKKISVSVMLSVAIVLMSACNMQKTSFPTDIYPKEVLQIPAADAAEAVVPDGYKVDVFMKDLIWPSSIEFDDAGNIYVAEAGYVYGDPFAPARVLQIAPDGEITRYATGFGGPVTDILFHDGLLYVSHKGKISRVESDGTVRDLVTGLPSYGDHFNNQLTVGPDGKIYFGQGTATNSGVVGLDNAYPYVWLLLSPDVHDVPAKDITLTGESFLTAHPNNVLSRQGRLTSLWKNVSYAVTSIFSRNKDKSMLVRTRGFQPFGEHARDIKGQTKASGTILRMNADGSELEVYAWGLRNPYGVLWGPDNKLYVTDNAYDERGSRPIANAKDNIYQIKEGGWYGFPDFSSGIPVTDEQFASTRGPELEFLMTDHPAVEQPWLTRPENAAAAKFDFSTSAEFGYEGHMFLAEFGSGTPLTAEGANWNGYSVVRIDPATKKSEPFLSHRATGKDATKKSVSAGPRHPVEAHFSPDGKVLYIVDIGVIGFALAGAGPFPVPVPGTGVIWRITKEDANESEVMNLSPISPTNFSGRK